MEKETISQQELPRTEKLAAERRRIETFIPDEAELRRANVVLDILKLLQAKSILVVVAGGYGLDALYGKVTRPHGDVDLICLAKDRNELRRILNAADFIQEKSDELKDVYIHSDPPDFKVEIVFDTSLQALTDEPVEMFMPEHPNGTLLTQEVTAVPIAAQRRIVEIQNARAEKQSWKAYSTEKEINREALLGLLEKNKSI